MDDASADVGLLTPFWVGTPVARATGDRAILDAMVEVELALIDAYVGLQLAPASVADTVSSVVRATRFDAASIAVRARDGGNPVIPLVHDMRAAVDAVDADAAQWVHRGATSQDILDTALMLVARHALALMLDDARSTITALARLADRHRHTLMVGRTLTQHGDPTTFGLKAAEWLYGVVRATRRLDAVRGRLPVQWGGAVGTLASFAIIGDKDTGQKLADAITEKLGLSVPLIPWQTERSPITDVADAITQLADPLGKIASDVLLLSRPEIGELAEPRPANRGGSSSMPQKHNPVLSVLISAATRRMPNLTASLHFSAITAVDERPDGAWHAEWAAFRELLRLIGGATALAAELTEGLGVNTDVMRANLRRTGPLIVSERLMLEFGPLLGRTKLQGIVNAAVDDPSVDLAARLRAEPALASVSDEHLNEVLDPANYLGAADELITRVLDDFATHGLGRPSHNPRA